MIGSEKRQIQRQKTGTTRKRMQVLMVLRQGLTKRRVGPDRAGAEAPEGDSSVKTLISTLNQSTSIYYEYFHTNNLDWEHENSRRAELHMF